MDRRTPPRFLSHRRIRKPAPGTGAGCISSKTPSLAGQYADRWFGASRKFPDVQTIIAHRPRQEACVFLLPQMPNRDGEPRAALVIPGRFPLVFPTLSDATAALRGEVAR